MDYLRVPNLRDGKLLKFAEFSLNFPGLRTKNFGGYLALVGDH